MDNKALLTIIAVILFGIFTIMIVQVTDETPAEKIGDSVSETVEEIGDNVNDGI